MPGSDSEPDDQVIHENPSADEPQSDDSNNTATFMTVGTDTFVTVVDPGKSLRDELRQPKQEPVSYDDADRRLVKPNKKAPADHADSKHSGSATKDCAMVELNVDHVDKAITKWVKNVNKNGVDTADLYLGKLLISEPEEMMQTVGDCISRAISEGRCVITGKSRAGTTSGPRELHLCSTGRIHLLDIACLLTRTRTLSHYARVSVSVSCDLIITTHSHSALCMLL